MKPATKRKTAWLLAAGLSLAPSLWAAGFWETKPFQTWSAKEIKQLRTNSPWAHAISATLSRQDVQGAPGSSRGGGAMFQFQRGGGGGGGGGMSSSMGGRGSTQNVSVPVEMVVRWQSALPMRHADLLEQYGEKVLQSPDFGRPTPGDAENYVIVLTGFPLLNERALNGTLEQAITQGVTIAAKDKISRKCANVQVATQGRAKDVTLTFPRIDPFTLKDQEVEFSVEVGPLKAKTKFRLKDMIYRDELAL